MEKSKYSVSQPSAAVNSAVAVSAVAGSSAFHTVAATIAPAAASLSTSTAKCVSVSLKAM